MGATLAEQYQRQEGWRRWSEALSLLPIRAGQRVLDLGCGVGHVAERLRRMRTEVVGIDGNEELLSAARSRYPEVRFERADLSTLAAEQLGTFDGLWASFVTAYFPDLAPALVRWIRCLRPGGWVGLVEMDDLFGHEPFPAAFREDMARFYEAARRAGAYDFEGGRSLVGAVRAAGLEVLREGVLPDDELSFAGAARPDVLEAWRERLQRMRGLQGFLGERFKDFEAAFLATLASDRHRSETRVVFVVARR
jgi:SAM-dependent methyltransferase